MAVDLLAGAVGEIVQVMALYPLDTVKVRRCAEQPCWHCQWQVQDMVQD